MVLRELREADRELYLLAASEEPGCENLYSDNLCANITWSLAYGDKGKRKNFAIENEEGDFVGYCNVEEGETPEQAVLRELQEECGLDGKIIRPLAVQYKLDGSAEYSFEVEVSEEQEAITGYDPEESTENPPLKEVLWMSLVEISEKDRAFLWAYGLLTVEEFFEKLKSWGDEISYPGEEE